MGGTGGGADAGFYSARGNVPSAGEENVVAALTAGRIGWGYIHACYGWWGRLPRVPRVSTRVAQERHRPPLSRLSTSTPSLA